MRIVNEVRALREAAGLTQTDLGDRIGLTRQTVAAIEQGRYAPSLEAAFAIADVLKKPLEAVFSRAP